MATQQGLVAATSLAVALADRGHRDITNSSRSERGGVMAEYGLLIALVFLVGIAAIAFFGETLEGVFTSVNEEFEAVRPNVTSPGPNARPSS